MMFWECIRFANVFNLKVSCFEMNSPHLKYSFGNDGGRDCLNPKWGYFVLSLFLLAIRRILGVHFTDNFGFCVFLGCGIGCM